MTEELNREELVHDFYMIDEVRDMVKIIIGLYQQQMFESYNKNVLVRNAGKFAATWEGPYMLDDIVG